MNDLIEKIAEYFKSRINPDNTATIETSNESIYLDLETGEMTSIYINEIWNIIPEGQTFW